MHKTHSSTPSSPLPAPNDNKAASSGGSRARAPVTSEQAGSSPSDSYPGSADPDPGLNIDTPLQPNSTKGGNTP
jgi:hypothetical protein